MDSQNTPSTRKNSSHLSRDQRLQVLTLHKVGQNRKEISDALGITIHQVIYTIRSGCVDPRKRTGRPRNTAAQAATSKDAKLAAALVSSATPSSTPPPALGGKKRGRPAGSKETKPRKKRDSGKGKVKHTVDVLAE